MVLNSKIFIFLTLLIIFLPTGVFSENTTIITPRGQLFLFTTNHIFKGEKLYCRVQGRRIVPGFLEDNDSQKVWVTAKKEIRRTRLFLSNPTKAKKVLRALRNTCIESQEINDQNLTPTPIPTLIFSQTPTPSPTPIETPIPTQTPPQNLSPIADAGPDKIVFELEEVVLDGTNSSDPEQGGLNYEWSQVGEPTIILMPISPGKVKLRSPLAPTKVIFQLRVSDQDPNSPDAFDEVSVLVRPIIAAYTTSTTNSDVITRATQLRSDGINSFLPKLNSLRAPLGQSTATTLNNWVQFADSFDGGIIPEFNWFGGNELTWFNSVNPPFIYEPFVNSQGQEIPVPCPSRASYWNFAVTPRMKVLAEFAIQKPKIKGGIIDFELYGAPEGTGKYEEACYCEDCIRDFFNSIGMQGTPVPLPEERYAWLIAQGLLDEYQSFERETTRLLARGMVEDVRAINPNFKIGTTATLRFGMAPFYMGLAKGLGEGGDPFYEFTQKTYNTGNNDNVLIPWLQQISQENFNARIVFGLWIYNIPVGNFPGDVYALVTRGAPSAGTWLYSADIYSEPELCYPFWQYREGLQEATFEIGNYLEGFPVYQSSLHHQFFSAGCIDTANFLSILPHTPLVNSNTPVDESLQLRNSTIYYFYANEGEVISFDIPVSSVNGSIGQGFWALLSPNGEVLEHRTLASGVTGQIRQVSTGGGVYGLYITPGGSNKFELKNRSHTGSFVGLHSEGLSLFKPRVPLYVYVPPGVANAGLLFTTAVPNPVGEPIEVSVFDTRIPEVPIFGPTVVSGPLPAPLVLSSNTEGVVLEIRFRLISGSEDVKLKVTDGALPFIAQSLSGLFGS